MAHDLFPTPDSDRANTLPVLVAAYNEEAAELAHTLASLAAQNAQLKQHGWSLRVIIGLDGWSLARDGWQLATGGQPPILVPSGPPDSPTSADPVARLVNPS